MMTPVLHCPSGQGTAIVTPGSTPEGKQRDRCRACPERGRTWLLEYPSAGPSPAIQAQIVDRALKASGMRETGRVLCVRPTPVRKERQKRHLRCNRCPRRRGSAYPQSPWRATSVALRRGLSAAGCPQNSRRGGVRWASRRSHGGCGMPSLLTAGPCWPMALDEERRRCFRS
jgi:transposase-like protein